MNESLCCLFVLDAVVHGKQQLVVAILHGKRDLAVVILRGKRDLVVAVVHGKVELAVEVLHGTIQLAANVPHRIGRGREDAKETRREEVEDGGEAEAVVLPPGVTDRNPNGGRRNSYRSMQSTIMGIRSAPNVLEKVEKRNVR